ncbi:MAG: RnfABCDGE type electron transport complex subunit G [Mariprofundaceae bacterium]|nr:RnfABCDGE type electron transport complex subunit G [Mariprofundaceae bacterium]
MKHITKEQKRMVVALLAVAVVCAIILGLTDRFTRGPIAEAKRQSMMNALMQVLPEHANDPLSDQKIVAGTAYFIARDAAHKVIAFAWEAIAPDGYSGSIHLLIGVDATGQTIGIRVTDHRETPGLGDGIVHNQDWLASFAHQTLDSRHWAVKKDGGDFDQFTGATISPRAIVNAVHRGLQQFAHDREALLQPAVVPAQSS